jgi:hypothetical protein
MKKVFFTIFLCALVSSCSESNNDIVQSDVSTKEGADSSATNTSLFSISKTKDWKLNDSLHSRALYVLSKTELFVGSYAGRLLKLTSDGHDLHQKLYSTPEDLEDIRGIVYHDGELVSINSGTHSVIFKNREQLNDHQEVYNKKNQFINGLLKWNAENKFIVFGDPGKNSKLVVLTSENGNEWNTQNGPKTLPNEAGFSASNTAMCIRPNGKVWIGTGGDSIARVHYSSDYGVHWTTYNSPLNSNESSGIFSMHFYDDLNGVAVGGSWLHPDSTKNISAITNDGGKTWTTTNDLRGYRSCVASNGKLTIACGRNGADYSLDQGKTWSPLFDEAFYTVVVKDGFAWFSGKEGTFRKIEF